MTAAQKAAIKAEETRKKNAYDDAVRGKSENELLAINYFYNKQNVKGCIKKKSVPMVTDEQYDALVNKQAALVTSQEVLDVLGLETPPQWIIDPLKVCTPEFNDAEYMRMGADGNARSSRITTTFLLYSKDIMYLYSRTTSLTDRQSYELSAGIMYRDITSVALKSENYDARYDMTDKGGCFKKSRRLSVWVPGSTHNVVITVPGKTYEINVGSAKTVMSSAIAQLREQIRRCK